MKLVVLTSKMAAHDASAPDMRAATQDWRTFPEFLAERHWVLLRSQEERQLKKVDTLARHLVAMGLRHPSERTQTTLAALVSHVSGQHNDEDFSKLATLLQTVKSVLKTHVTRARQVSAPVFTHNLQTLPATVAELPEAMRNRFFPAGAFAPPMDMIPIHASAAIWPCRSTNRQAGLNRQVSGADFLLAGGPSVTMVAQQAALQTAAAFAAHAFGRNAGGGFEVPGLEILPAGQRAIENAQARTSSLGALLDRAQPQTVPEAAPEAVTAATDGVIADPSTAALALPGGRTTPAPQLAAASVASAAEPVVAAPSIAEPVTAQELGPDGEAQRAQADLEKSVLGLAQSHYGATLPALQAPDGYDDGASKKRPAARNPAVKRGRPAASAATVKKELGKTGGAQKKPSARVKPLSKPAACVKAIVKKGAAAKTLTVVTRKEALKQRPKGCGRCRETPGCCPSCWVSRGYRLQP